MDITLAQRLQTLGAARVRDVALYMTAEALEALISDLDAQ